MSTTAAPLLTVDLLEELSVRWMLQRAPIVEYLRPGLADATMDELCAPLGLVVPAAARVWWGWHDGAEIDGRRQATEMVGTGWRYAPLSLALDRTRSQRHITRATGAQTLDPDELWPSEWLVLSEGPHAGLIAVDGRASNDAATPVYSLDHGEKLSDARQPRARTLGEMVSWWIEGMDDGAVNFDAASGRWNYLYERLDPRRERTRLI